VAKANSQSGTRGDATRQRLLRTAVEIFGRNGFEGTSTRMLADAGGVNLQAIAYYFGGKDGLYREAAELVAATVSGHVATTRDRIRERLDAGPLSPEEARPLLGELLRVIAELFIDPGSEALSRFIVREQMAPTDTFSVLSDGMIKPLFGVLAELVAVLLGEETASEHVRLRTLALFGGVMVFRVAHGAALTVLGWPGYGARESCAVRTLADELAASVRR
jgi:TetR/AcrR family transcriptional regulator, regulator of cefoperazone and chloramphenicol sensitivity